ncbi:MAG: rhodanese-like domain-containing protein [Lentisphaerae bacterium]|nr:rhodanese-like domain-containing protein [Lentisphaerota bacterium]
MKKFFAAVTAIISALAGAGCSSPTPVPAEIPDNAILLDVRTQKEFAERHIPGSLLIPHDQIAEKAPALLPDKNAPIALFCRSGRRSAIAKGTLESLGYTAVIDLGAIDNAAKVLNKETISQ